MSAPSTAYLNGGSKLCVHQIGVVKYDNLAALKLSAYGASIRELFYVHHLLIVQNGSQVGFLGAVEANTGESYYQMHSTARHSKLRIKNPANGKVYIVLNDAGLNTKGEVYLYQVLSTSVAGIVMSANFKSAYYVDSTQFGFQYRQFINGVFQGWSVIDLQPSYGAISQRTNQTISSPAFIGRRETPFQIQAFITNSEGIKYGEIETIYPTAVPITLNGTTYYIDTPSIESADNGGATRLYQSSDFTNYIQTGGTYYIDATHYYTYGYNVWTNDFCFLTYVDNTVPVPTTPPSWTYGGYSADSQASADNQVIGGANQYSGTLYFNGNDNRWYQGYSGVSPNFSFSGTPSDGFYSEGDVSGVNSQKYLINGVNQY